MASDILLRTILIVRKETRCRHMGYSYRLTARVLLYEPSHRQDNTYHGLCYTSRGALAGTRNSSMGPPHEGSIRRPIAPWANALPLSYVPLLHWKMTAFFFFLHFSGLWGCRSDPQTWPPRGLSVHIETWQRGIGPAENTSALFLLVVHRPSLSLTPCSLLPLTKIVFDSLSGI